MYSYEAEKAALFTDEGQRAFLKVRDAAQKLLKQSGAFRQMEVIREAQISGDSFFMLACVDRFGRTRGNPRSLFKQAVTIPRLYRELLNMSESADTQRVQIRYTGTSHFWTACVSHTWKRGDAEIQRGQVGSSSGPKDYLKNDIIALFQANPQVESVTLLVLNRTPFLVMRAGRVYFDCSEREIELQRVEAAS